MTLLSVGDSHFLVFPVLHFQRPQCIIPMHTSNG